MVNRNDILKCLGTFPKKVNLDMREISSEDMESYERKLIEYNVEKCNENIRVQNKEIIEKTKKEINLLKDFN